MRSKLAPILIALALGSAVAVAQNDQPRGDLYSAKAVQALEQCFDGAGVFLCGGNVVGPASATDNAVVRWDTSTGTLLQNGVCVETDAGEYQCGNGSAAAPTYSFLSDTNAGIYRVGANDFLFQNNDAGALSSLRLRPSTATLRGTNGISAVSFLDVDGTTAGPPPRIYGNTTDGTSTGEISINPAALSYTTADGVSQGSLSLGQNILTLSETDGTGISTFTSTGATGAVALDWTAQDGANSSMLSLSAPGAAGTSYELVNLTSDLTAMDGGGDTVSAIEIFLTNADHTGTENRLRGLLIDSIGGDADADETAIYLDADGWDQAFFVNGDPTLLMRLTGTNPVIDISDMSVFQIQNQLGNGDIEFTLNPVSHTIDLFAGDDVTGFDTEFQLVAVTAPATTSAVPLTANVSDLDGGDDLRILNVTVNTPGGSTGTGNLINGVDMNLGGTDPDFVASALRIRTGFDSFLTAEVDADGWSASDDPPTNSVALYIDESGANCNLLARLSDGTEITVAILVVAGNCP